ncbi:MAG: hypothetical protein IT273_14575 [Chitinophagales bacterium]|nr:hypothetical protein [Chitinophagales bacterium]
MDKKVPFSISIRSSLSDSLKQRANEEKQTLSYVVEKLLCAAIENESQLAELAEKDRLIEILKEEKEKAERVAKLSYSQLDIVKKRLSEFIN